MSYLIGAIIAIVCFCLGYIARVKIEELQKEIK